MKISIVMPALNEEAAIADVIDEIPVSKLKKDGHKVEIIVVDGKSVDDTAKIAKKKGARVISSERGYGRQYKLGFSKATGDIIVTGDSDMTYPFKDTHKFVKQLLAEDLDFITTNRFAGLKDGAMTGMHHFGNSVLTLFTRLFFRVNIKDSQSGMWIFRKNILKDLDLTSDGMPMSQEIKIEAFKKVKAKEIPIDYYARVGDVKLSTFKDGFRNLFFFFGKRIR